ncbi:uncharacterized protein LOC110990303 [Acanthaster planci]|uniref:Uncharacterized protein LOC110990303 n=1 Tax=Acanthaster planci TaxID=133434 RepID=A0A8B8A4Q4_ACAPL|nr:uncharacterized protein LOC110990303 [Acanthaster planci]
MNFALVPQSSPIEDIIQHTEPILRHLDKSAANEIRLQVHQALRKHKPTKPNISKLEQAAINSLPFYRELRKDPTPSIERRLQQKLLSLQRTGTSPSPFTDATTIAKDRLAADPAFKDRTDLTPEQLHDLLLTCVNSSSFRWRDKFFEQSAGTSMGSPISPVLAGMFMEEFEQPAINTSDHRPKVWLRFVEDILVIWQHGQDNLRLSLEHLNGLHSSIQFTMEQDPNGNISFLDVQVTRKEDGSLARTVYRQPTHTERYHHNTSFHHPKIKSSVNWALVGICYKEFLGQELHHISAALQRNGYKRSQVKTHDPRSTPGQRVSYRPYPKPTMYIGETGRDIPTRINEHKAHGRKGELEKSSIIKHARTEDHQINWSQAELITSIEQWYPRRIREAIEIIKRDTVPQDIGFSISDIWRPSSHPSPMGLLYSMTPQLSSLFS